MSRTRFGVILPTVTLVSSIQNDSSSRRVTTMFPTVDSFYEFADELADARPVGGVVVPSVDAGGVRNDDQTAATFEEWRSGREAGGRGHAPAEEDHDVVGGAVDRAPRLSGSTGVPRPAAAGGADRASEEVEPVPRREESVEGDVGEPGEPAPGV